MRQVPGIESLQTCWFSATGKFVKCREEAMGRLARDAYLRLLIHWSNTLKTKLNHKYPNHIIPIARFLKLTQNVENYIRALL